MTSVICITTAVLFITNPFFLQVLASRRDTTAENVDSIFQRFSSDSNGKATFRGEYSGGGRCSLDPPPPLATQEGWVAVAVGKEDYHQSLACGMCLEIHNKEKGNINGIVYDLCETCGRGDVNLYIPGSGSLDITITAIDCPSVAGAPGYIHFHFTGSNEFYFKLQARNTKVPVAGIEVYNPTNGEWFCLNRNDKNYFVSNGLGQTSFPMKVRLTSIFNEQLQYTIPQLKNDNNIVSDVQFSDTDVRGGSPAGIKCHGQGSRPNNGQTDQTFCAGKTDGTYADPKDCSGFYECTGGNTVKKYCSLGQLYNALISRCDVAENVNCPVQKDYQPSKEVEQNINSMNTEYDSSKEESGTLDARIANIKNKEEPISGQQMPYQSDDTHYELPSVYELGSNNNHNYILMEDADAFLKHKPFGYRHGVNANNKNENYLHSVSSYRETKYHPYSATYQTFSNEPAKTELKNNAKMLSSNFQNSKEEQHKGENSNNLQPHFYGGLSPQNGQGSYMKVFHIGLSNGKTLEVNWPIRENRYNFQKSTKHYFVTGEAENEMPSFEIKADTNLDEENKEGGPQFQSNGSKFPINEEGHTFDNDDMAHQTAQSSYAYAVTGNAKGSSADYSHWSGVPTSKSSNTMEDNPSYFVTQAFRSPRPFEYNNNNRENGKSNSMGTQLENVSKENMHFRTYKDNRNSNSRESKAGGSHYTSSRNNDMVTKNRKQDSPSDRLLRETYHYPFHSHLTADPQIINGMKFSRTGANYNLKLVSTEDATEDAKDDNIQTRFQGPQRFMQQNYYKNARFGQNQQNKPGDGTWEHGQMSDLVPVNIIKNGNKKQTEVSRETSQENTNYFQSDTSNIPFVNHIDANYPSEPFKQRVSSASQQIPQSSHVPPLSASIPQHSRKYFQLDDVEDNTPEQLSPQLHRSVSFISDAEPTVYQSNVIAHDKPSKRIGQLVSNTLKQKFKITKLANQQSLARYHQKGNSRSVVQDFAQYGPQLEEYHLSDKDSSVFDQNTSFARPSSDVKESVMEWDDQTFDNTAPSQLDSVEGGSKHNSQTGEEQNNEPEVAAGNELPGNSETQDDQQTSNRATNHQTSGTTNMSNEVNEPGKFTYVDVKQTSRLNSTVNSLPAHTKTENVQYPLNAITTFATDQDNKIGSTRRPAFLQYPPTPSQAAVARPLVKPSHSVLPQRPRAKLYHMVEEKNKSGPNNGSLQTTELESLAGTEKWNRTESYASNALQNVTIQALEQRNNSNSSLNGPDSSILLNSGMTGKDAKVQNSSAKHSMDSYKNHLHTSLATNRKRINASNSRVPGVLISMQSDNSFVDSTPTPDNIVKADESSSTMNSATQPTNTIDIRIHEGKQKVSVRVGKLGEGASNDPDEYATQQDDVVSGKLKSPRIATFCSSKPNGIHADPDDRSSFIVCYNGETEERRCPLELKFNPREKLCDLPVEGFSSGRGFIRSKYGHMHNLVKAYRGMPSRQLNLIEKRFKANKLFDKRRRLRRLRYRLIRKN